MGKISARLFLDPREKLIRCQARLSGLVHVALLRRFVPRNRRPDDSGLDAGLRRAEINSDGWKLLGGKRIVDTPEEGINIPGEGQF